MDVIRIYNDFNVPYITEGHRHARDGWVNTECPFCTGNPGYHLGWNIADEYFVCWRCGFHPPFRALSFILNIPSYEIMSVLSAYTVNRTPYKKKEKNKKEFALPSNVGKLFNAHKSYLKNRGFNYKQLIKTWNLKATGRYSRLDNINYNARIIIPFYWNGAVVSFDSRAIFDTKIGKYKACPEEREIIGHKRILYGKQEYWHDTGIVVEGPFDVWRLGTAACSVSGINYTHAQVKILSKTFNKVAVVFDSEPQAQKQAQKLIADLRFRGIDAWNVQVKDDPGSLKQHEADELVKQILNK